MEQRKLVTVIGATGMQGGSVIKHLLDHTSEYSIRAVTRNHCSTAAKNLITRGVEVVQADLWDINSLIEVFRGSYAIFGVTNFWKIFEHASKEVAAAQETEQGKNIVDAATTTLGTLQQFIWSTLADTASISDGDYIVPHYQSKVAVNHYIESKPELFAKTTFLWCSYYAANLTRACLEPVYIPTADKYIQIQGVPEDTPMAFIGDTAENLGAFVKAILDQPGKTGKGKTVFAYIERTTLGEILQSWARVHGVKAQYVQVSKETYCALFGRQAKEMDLGMTFWDHARNKDWTATNGIMTYRAIGVDLSRLLGPEQSMAMLPL
ncbi:hypothetical protein NECHADRAFT_97421 [Paecilomyces variotii No. 5]|uniref:NmrA-like domain-containing protein n=1 Tax=Byssochlamys spectabilis (strain No. 5 / NBRC 109023) TaxID=1356009 RepID=V5FTX2_BYSSN|nr:hypothetical protein NECHADRAFT_97421 [Paecilomyces variotii No. 5]